MYDLVTFGECMLRLSPPGFQRIEQATSFNANAGGAEMNVAVAASRFGMRTAYVTCLPNNPLGRMITNKIREHGVDCSHIVYTKEGRTGIYFVEFGANPRPNTVLYDRGNSAISNIRPGGINWNVILQDVRVFHTSGITPALSKNAEKVTREAMEIASKKGATVSFDLNYRAKLWSEEEAQKIITPLMEFCDILITTEEDTYRVFKIKKENYEKVAEELQKAFNFRIVVITLRENITVWRNNWTAIAYSDGKLYRDETYEVEVVDRVGSGDSFTAGFLYGYLKFKKDIEMALKYGNASAVLKHSIPGDLNLVTIDEVKKIVEGKRTIRIER